ncbi:uncharacterized protein [Dermacentor albipictus]
MEQHPYLARGSTSLSPSMSAAQKRGLWAEIAAALNAVGPAVKIARRWRLYWARMAYECKKLAAQVGAEKRKTGGGKLGGLEGRVIAVLAHTGPASAPADFFHGNAEEDAACSSEESAEVPPAPPAAARVSVGTEPGTSGTAPRQQPRRPPRLQVLTDAASSTAADYARQSRLAEAANAEAASFHQQLLQQHRQLVEEQRATRQVLEQLVAEMRGSREANTLIATTLRQLLAALADLRAPPQH